MGYIVAEMPNRQIADHVQRLAIDAGYHLHNYGLHKNYTPPFALWLFTSENETVKTIYITDHTNYLLNERTLVTLESMIALLRGNQPITFPIYTGDEETYIMNRLLNAFHEAFGE